MPFFLPRLPRAIPKVPISRTMAVVTPPSGAPTWVLEDMRLPAPRLNGDGDDMIGVYTGEGNTNQVVTFPGDGTMKVAVTTPALFYIDFRTRDGGYLTPGSKLKAHLYEGTWSDTINCLAFIMKWSTARTRRSDGGDNIEFGTYIHDPAETDYAQAGAHYYHYANMEIVANKWYKIWVDDKPQTQVGAEGEYPPDPKYATQGVHYMSQMNRFYIDGQPLNDTWGTQDVYLAGMHYIVITGQERSKIATVIGGYDGTKYEISFATPRNTEIEYQVRYSTASMLVNGFTSGTLGGKGGGTVTSRGDTYVIVDWQSPSMAESVTGMFFAIRATGDTLFREVYLPYQLSPSNYWVEGP